MQADPLRFKSRVGNKLYPLKVVKAADPSQCVLVCGDGTCDNRLMRSSPFLQNCVAEFGAFVLLSFHASHLRKLASDITTCDIIHSHHRSAVFTG